MQISGQRLVMFADAEDLKMSSRLSRSTIFQLVEQPPSNGKSHWKDRCLTALTLGIQLRWAEELQLGKHHTIFEMKSIPESFNPIHKLVVWHSVCLLSNTLNSKPFRDLRNEKSEE